MAQKCFVMATFGDTIVTYESIGFLVISDLALLLIGLVMVKNFSKGIEPQ